MNYARNRRKLSKLLNHRKAQYERALDGVINGTHSPEYAKERWQKLKPVLPRRKH